MNDLCITTSLDSGELASWVQAIGSILAIVTGLAAVYLQVRATRLHALEMEARDTARRLSAVTAVVEDARQQCQQLRKWVASDAKGRLKYYIGGTSAAFQNSTQRLRAISPFEIGNRELAEIINRIAVQMESVSHALGRSSEEQIKVWAFEITNSLDGIEQDCEAASAAMRKALT